MTGGRFRGMGRSQFRVPTFLASAPVENRMGQAADPAETLARLDAALAWLHPGGLPG